MASQFSDPAWWPKPPPKPPTPISMKKVLFGTVLPGVAIIVGGILIFSLHTSSASTTRSVKAFQACLAAHGYRPGSSSDVARSAYRACRDKLPPGARVGTPGTGGGDSSTQEQMTECLRSATKGLSFRDPRNRDAIEKAIQLCRALIESGGRQPAPTTSAPAAPPTI